MSRDKRQKATDVFNESKSFLGGKVSFAQAFPKIQHIIVKVHETGDGVWVPPPGGKDDDPSSVYTETSLGEYINCSNSICYKGGFRMGWIIREMVRNREEKKDFSGSCQGYEGSPKGHKNYGPCGNYFKGNVEIEYIDDGPKEKRGT